MSKKAWSPGRMMRSVKLCGMRGAALARDRVDGLHAVRPHLVEPLVGERHDVALAHARLERLEDVLVDAVAHGRGHVEQHQLVDVLDHAGLQHHLLAVAHLEAQLLQGEQERRLDHVDAERHVGHALAGEDVPDLARGLLEEAGLRRDRPAHAHHAGQALVGGQLRGGEPVVARGGAEVPHPGLAVAGEQAPAGQLVAGPLADHGARDVADVVLVEDQQRAQARLGERAPGAGDAVVVEAAEVHALLEIHLGVARGLDGPVPPVLRVDRVGLRGRGLPGPGRCRLARHLRLLGLVVDDGVTPTTDASFAIDSGAR